MDYAFAGVHEAASYIGDMLGMTTAAGILRIIEVAGKRDQASVGLFLLGRL